MFFKHPYKTEKERICELEGQYSIFFFFCLFLSFVVVVVAVAISWAAPAAYGGSQARG